MANVTLKNVTKVFDRRTRAVDDLVLDVQDGELMVLVGPSGCGKSTTLRLVAGLEEPTSGQILIGERVVNCVHPKDRNIAMVFQNYALYPHMTVAGNMGFALRNRGVKRAEVRRRVELTAASLSIAELLDRKPAQLSGGQQQRVALGRAIVRDPAVFLFDEPLSNLDAALRSRMRAEIRSLQRRLGTTSIWVTHDQDEAMTLGDRIAVMGGGRLHQVGAPLDVYDRPENRFVASFIGSPGMNLVEGRLERADGEMGRDGAVVFREGGADTPSAARIDLSNVLALAAQSSIGSAVTLGFRPHTLRPLAAGDASASGFEIAIDLIEPRGDVIDVTGTTRVGTRLTARFPAHAAPRGERALTIVPAPDGIHLFAPGDAGRNLIGASPASPRGH